MPIACLSIPERGKEEIPPGSFSPLLLYQPRMGICLFYSIFSNELQSFLAAGFNNMIQEMDQKLNRWFLFFLFVIKIILTQI